MPDDRDSNPDGVGEGNVEVRASLESEIESEKDVVAREDGHKKVGENIEVRLPGGTFLKASSHVDDKHLRSTSSKSRRRVALTVAFAALAAAGVIAVVASVIKPSLEEEKYEEPPHHLESAIRDAGSDAGPQKSEDASANHRETDVPEPEHESTDGKATVRSDAGDKDEQPFESRGRRPASPIQPSRPSSSGGAQIVGSENVVENSAQSVAGDNAVVTYPGDRPAAKSRTNSGAKVERSKNVVVGSENSVAGDGVKVDFSGSAAGTG